MCVELQLQVVDEVGSLGKIAGPIVMTTVLIYSRATISMLFLGRMGKVELAGGSLAISFSNISGISLIKGLAMGMDPICCQAFGAKKYSVITQTFQKTLCLLLLVSLPISIMWLNIEPIFLRLGQDPDITRVAKVYLAFSIPELLAQACLHVLRTFLRTQGLTTPLTIASFVALLLHLPITYLLATYFNLGLKGIALALACNTLNLNLGLLIFLFVSTKPLIKPWHGLTIVSLFQGWKPLLSLSLPSCISVCLEWWWYEIMLFLCGLVTNPKASVAAMGICIQTTGWLYVFPFALNIGLATRVGHALGAGQPARAQYSTIIGLILAFAFGLASFSFLSCMKTIWARMYTDEPQILEVLYTALPILGLCEVGNSPQTAACGVLTGSAQPKTGARINLCAFYFIGLPVAILFTFKLDFGLRGLLFGLLASQMSCLCMMGYAVIKIDWKHQVKRAKELTMAAGEIQEEAATAAQPDDDDDLEAALLADDDDGSSSGSSSSDEF